MVRSAEQAKRPGRRGGLRAGMGRETGQAGHVPAVLSFFSDRLDAVPPQESSEGSRSRASRRGCHGPDIHAWVCGLACEQSVLLRPIERQIEFRQTRRGKVDGLAPPEHRFDELWAEKSEVHQTPDVTPRDAVTFGQFLERSGTAAGELLKPRASARDRLHQRGIILAVWFCCARPGSTSLVSTPRRLRPTVAVSSIVPSVWPSVADDRTPPPTAGRGASRL